MGCPYYRTARSFLEAARIGIRNTMARSFVRWAHTERSLVFHFASFTNRLVLLDDCASVRQMLQSHMSGRSKTVSVEVVCYGKRYGFCLSLHRLASYRGQHTASFVAWSDQPIGHDKLFNIPGMERTTISFNRPKWNQFRRSNGPTAEQARYCSSSFQQQSKIISVDRRLCLRKRTGKSQATRFIPERS